MFDYNIGNATPKEDILLLYDGATKYGKDEKTFNI